MGFLVNLPETQASDLRYFEQKISSITSKYRRVFAWRWLHGRPARWVEGIARHEFHWAQKVPSLFHRISVSDVDFME